MMRSGHRHFVVLAVLLGGFAAAQDPRGSPPSDSGRQELESARIALGERLFESTLLSSNRKLSCASCHDPARSFTEAAAESKGVFRISVGRNAPSLVGVASFPGFVGPPPPPPTDPQKPAPTPPPEPEVLDLAARCLAPIENPLEMGSTVDDAVRAVRAMKDMTEVFDHAFGRRGVGVTAERMGEALASYLRSIRPPESPYRALLEGEEEALADHEWRGRAIFAGPGRCAACHSGEALSDGLFHAAFTPASFRAQLQREGSRDRIAKLTALAAQQPAKKPRRRPATSDPLLPRPLPDVAQTLALATTGNGVGYYNQIQVQAMMQTPTLWDVARTGPYFRDGSVQELETAVRQHIEELRAVAAASQGIRLPLGVSAASIPKALVADWGPGGPPAPDDLNEHQIGDLMGFLRSLSPRL